MSSAKHQKKGVTKRVVETPIVFIDLSNYIFQRYFAINAWSAKSGFKFEESEDGKKMFFDIYKTRFQSNLEKLKKKLKFEWKDLYMVRDCPRETIWRTTVYPDYKKNRENRAGQTIDCAVFPLTYDVILPGMNVDFTVLKYERAEADDIVGVLHRKFRELCPTRPIVIITNDNDYLQLIDSHTLIINASFKEIRSRVAPHVIVDGQTFIRYKVIKGDTSDNIPGIAYKMNDKTAIELATNVEAFQTKMKDPVVKNAYERNDVLMNFDRIPSDIRKGIEDLVIIKPQQPNHFQTNITKFFQKAKNDITCV